MSRIWVATTTYPSLSFAFPTRSLLVHDRHCWRQRQPSCTRLLNRAEFARVLPAGGEVLGAALSPTFIATNAN